MKKETIYIISAIISAVVLVAMIACFLSQCHKKQRNSEAEIGVV